MPDAQKGSTGEGYAKYPPPGQQERLCLKLPACEHTDCAPMVRQNRGACRVNRDYRSSEKQRQERLDAFKRGELIDRPILSVHYVPPETAAHFNSGYYQERVFGDAEANIRHQLDTCGSTWRGGDAQAGSVSLSLGPDECAAFCGAKIDWSEDSMETNWSVPIVRSWDDNMPLGVQPDSEYWLKSLHLYTLAAEMVPAEWGLSMPDLHSNMDLLAALRGPLQLCVDMMEQPELMDMLFKQTVEVVRFIHDELSTASGRPGLPATLQSDFCCLIGGEMFRRWILPTLEAESEIVGQSVFHWDGPDAVKHLDDIASVNGIYAVAYVPGAGRGDHIDYMELYREVQSRGMGVCVSGTPDELKWMHGELNPAKTIFSCGVSSSEEGMALIEWFENNT